MNHDLVIRELLGIGAAIRRVGRGVFQFAPDHPTDYAVIAVGPLMKQNSFPSGSAITWKPPSSS